MRLLVLSLFLTSGACALIYEITWTRMLTLVFGSTSFAVSTILASFMAGFGLGSYFFGKYIDRRGNPLMVYGVLEAIIGLFALLFPFIVAGLTQLNVYIHRDLWPDASYYQLSAVKFLIYFLTVLIPASMMGATFPIIVKFFVRHIQKLGEGVSVIYTINTLGAVIGCLATGFILIRTLGLTATTYWTAGLNLLIGVIAIALSRAARTESITEAPAPQAPQKGDSAFTTPVPLSHGMATVVLVAFFLSGFCALAYEVLWTRMLVFAAGVTTYAFSAMLATFLCGLAIGSIVFAKIIDRQKNLLLLFAILQFAIGLTAYASQFVLYRPAFFLAIETGESLEFAHTWAEFARRLFTTTAGLMLIPTVLMGATFPLVNKIYVGSLGSLGSGVGRAYLLNSIGSAMGAMVVGFLIIPAVGIGNGVAIIAVINILLGGFLLFNAGSPPPSHTHARYPLTAICLSVLFVGAIIVHSFSEEMSVVEKGLRKALSKNYNVLHHREGMSGTITVREHKGNGARSLLIEGFDAAGTGTDYNYMRMLGHLPMLLCDDPKDVLVIAFGTGTTSGTIGMYEHERFDIVELCQDVIDSDHHFVAHNRNIIDDERTSVVIDDGRNHVLTTTRKYDVISMEPMPPYFPGAMNLYTRDFYKLCKARLTDKGVMCQWLPPHSQSGPDQRGLLRAFAEAFEHTSLWYFEGTLAVVGAQQELSISLPQLAERMKSPAVHESFKQTGLHDPLLFVAHYLMGSETIKRYVADVEPATDDNPYVEFFSIPKKSALFYQCLNCLDSVNRAEDPFPLLRDIPQGKEAEVRSGLADRVKFVHNKLRQNIGEAARRGRFTQDLLDAQLPLQPAAGGN